MLQPLRIIIPIMRIAALIIIRVRFKKVSGSRKLWPRWRQGTKELGI